MSAKVFCLGMGKTGTATWREAMKIIGYEKFCNSRDALLPAIKKGDWDLVWGVVDSYDAFKGWPWAIIYKELDEKYPGSKFVYLERDTESWYESNFTHFYDDPTDMREWIFGAPYPKDHKEEYISTFVRHGEQVKEHFKDRPGDLLVMDIINGDGWEKLCPFLGVPIPGDKWPWANVKRVNKKLR